MTGFAFPEGALSGYFPEEESFLHDIDPAETARAIEEIAGQARNRRCHCLFGTALPEGGNWYNAVVIVPPTGPLRTYRKIEISGLDGRHFAPGTDRPVYRTGGTTIGVQVCREVLFPAAWADLRDRGARIVFHINNAIKPHDAEWRHILRTRAAENGYFVCSVNNAAPPQELTSYLFDPAGRMLLSAARQSEQVLTREIDRGGL